MTSTRMAQLFGILVLAASLCVVSMWVVPRLKSERDAVMPRLEKEKLATLDPSSTIANAALTVFRGIAVDVLWYQANKNKEDGRYFDANRKAEMITSLQPRFPKVWAFHAWNMAYNISVATYTPEERWDWVNKGINLLRERGIPYNPKAIILYKELGWIFGHKVGQFSDDMHWYYKRNLAQEWQEVLAPNDGLKTPEALAQFKPIAEAPDTLEEVTAKNPAVVKLIDALKGLSQPLRPDESLLRRVNRLMMFNNTKSAAMLAILASRAPKNFDALDRELTKILADKQYADAFPPLMAHLRRRVIIDRYHMSPERMYEFMELFGPLDFRHPGAHACYWATMGTKVAEQSMPPGEVDLLNTYRGSIHGLQALRDGGRVNYDPVTRKLDYLPDPRYIAAYEKMLELTRAATSHTESGQAGPSKDSFDAGYENFLMIAIQYSYLYGDEEQALHYFNKARKLFGHKEDNIRSHKYDVTLEDLVLREMTDTIDILAHARQAIDGLLTQAFMQGLRSDRREVYDKFVKLALHVHTKFNEKAGLTPLADQKRMGLLPFDKILEESMLGILRDAVDPLDRARIWLAAGGISELAPARYAIYDVLKEKAWDEAKREEFNPEMAFPEPPGMDAWRLTNKPAPKATGQTLNASGTPSEMGRLNSDAVGTENRPPAIDDSVRVEKK